MADEDEEHRADAHHLGGAHMEEHDTGHDDHDEQGHDEERLGPIDWPAWAATAAGVGIALVTAALFLVAVTPH
jgi:hypothetical protein